MEFVEKNIIPKKIFIVPYRNRKEHKFFFCNQMNFILNGETDYEIYFSHQFDERPFNRGATKNIGFLKMKETYPNDYKNITFIFNDIDTLPFHKIFEYETTKGIVKHYYGFEYALGGIVVIKGEDFERTNGYPNFWGWGNEDTVFQTRCLKNKLIIDRKLFFKIGSPEILQLFDGVKRIVSPKEYKIGLNDSGIDGISSLHRLTTTISSESLNLNDNTYVVDNPRIKIINILSFLTSIRFENSEYYNYDLRQSTNTIINPKKEQLITNVVTTTDDWKKNIYNHNNYAIKPQQQQFYKPRTNASKSVNIKLGGVY